MRQRSVLEINEARRILDAALACAEQQQLPVAVAVTDDAGDVLVLQRLATAHGYTSEVASKKARCAATTQRPTSFWAERIKDMPGFAQLPNMCALAGGVPIMVNGQCVGAVGVSGARGPGQDDLVAEAGIAALT